MSNNDDERKPAAAAAGSLCAQCELGPNDVVMGRGSGANLKEGNIRFRQFVWDQYKEKMAHAEGLTIEESVSIKNKVSEEVLAHIKSKGGHFVRKTLKQEYGEEDDSCGFGSRQVVYEEVSDKEALDKIKQTLRFQIERRNGNRSRSKALEALRALGASGSSPMARNVNQLLSPQAMNDHLLQLISQERIAKLIQGKNKEVNAQKSSTDATNGTNTNSGVARNPVIIGINNTASWLPLCPAAVVAPGGLPVLSNTSRRASLSSQTTAAPLQSPRPLTNPSLTMGYLQIQASPISILHRPSATNEQHQVTCIEDLIKLTKLSGAVCPTAPTLGATSPLNAPSAMPTSAMPGNQSKLETLIQQEEVKLVLEKIKTHRLSEMLRQSNTPFN
ncbi:MAG: hypothetical protein SGILL_005739 [Bacillariaceae sp.]